MRVRAAPARTVARTLRCASRFASRCETRSRVQSASRSILRPASRSPLRPASPSALQRASSSALPSASRFALQRASRPTVRAHVIASSIRALSREIFLRGALAQREWQAARRTSRATLVGAPPDVERSDRSEPHRSRSGSCNVRPRSVDRRARRPGARGGRTHRRAAAAPGAARHLHRRSASGDARDLRRAGRRAALVSPGGRDAHARGGTRGRDERRRGARRLALGRRARLRDAASGARRP